MMHLLNTHFYHLFVFLEIERESVERERESVKREKERGDGFWKHLVESLCAFVNLTSITESLVEEKRLPIAFPCLCMHSKINMLLKQYSFIIIIIPFFPSFLSPIIRVLIPFINYVVLTPQFMII